ncbi:hypothetical protein F4557_006180 [Actinomadura catellatispora]|uniref:Uncharacterized protein n=1 Tax=Actinomadura livida TaxID=79909 RepID=A0A7W7IIK5_9ACTN|nr:hypothetical protein [Actinomadura catellatispora]
MNSRHFIIAPPPSPRVPARPYGMISMAWAHDFPDS